MEVDKLKRTGKEISFELVNELIMPTPEDKIFEMVDSLLTKKRERAFELFRDLKELKESPIKMVSILYTKIKQVLQVQMYADLPNAELAGRTGLTFYQVNKTRDVIGKFTLDELAKMLMMVQETEVKMKTGQVDIDLGMEFLMLKILQF
jgi:DNA polymerase III subunit delta